MSHAARDARENIGLKLANTAAEKFRLTAANQKPL